MKRNVNVFIAVVLCAALCGGIVWLQTAGDEKLGWNIHDAYGEAPAYSNGAAYTNATFAGPSASEGGVMSLSPSRLLRARSSYSYAGAYSSVATQPFASSPLTSSAPAGGGLYATSSQTFNSYGGGGNGGAMGGGAMSNGRSNSGLSTPSLGGAGVGSISPIAYSTARRSDMTVAAGENLAMMAAENPMMSVASAANAGMGNSFYGYSVMDYSGSANYGQYTGMFGGGSRSNVRGRQNVDAPTFGEDPWWVWLDNWAKGSGYGQGEDADGDGYADGGYLLDEEQINEAYKDFLKGWDYELGNPPSPQQWWDWYYSYMYAHGGEYWYNGHRYFWTPVGDILPLLLIALLYLLFMVIKSKSLKTERNE